MANRKLTEIPELTSITDDDLGYIVDVSDTTESAQGTSKKFKKSTLWNYIASKIVVDSNNYIILDNGYTFVGTLLTFNAGWEWRINNADYTNAVAVTFTIPLATSGYSRIDLIILNTSNTFVKIDGVQSLGTPVSPSLPVNTIQALFIYVDSTFSTPVIPRPKWAVSQQLRDGEQTYAPSENVVFDALATKQNQLIEGANITIDVTDPLNPIISASGGGATNLAYTPSPTNGIVVSDTGTDATLPLADATNAGLLKPAKFTVLENTSGTNTGDQDLSGKENTSNKQNSLTVDGTGVKFPTVDAVNTGLATKGNLISLLKEDFTFTASQSFVLANIPTNIMSVIVQMSSLHPSQYGIIGQTLTVNDTLNIGDKITIVYNWGLIDTISYTKSETDLRLNQMGSVPYFGSISSSDTPIGTGKAFWLATQAGTYTNFGGVVVSANSFAVISRDAAGAFSISQTALDITSKVNVSDVINTLSSTETAKPLSANQGRILSNILFKFETIWTEGFYISPDGNSYSEVGFKRTDFINVLAGRDYYSNYGHNLAFYDIDKLFISYVNTANVTIPANCVYVRFSTTLSISDVRFYDTVSLHANLANKNVVNTIENKLKKLDTYFTWTDGFYQVSDGTVYPDASFAISDMFLVSENTVYNLSNVHRLLFFKEDKTVIGENTVTSNKTTSPALAYYCRISQYISNKTTSYFYNAENNFYNLVSRKEFEVVNASNKRIAKTVNYDTISKLDSLSSLDKVKATVIGTAGTEGAIYTIPLQSRGGEYRLSFDLKLPRDLNNGDVATVVPIASIPYDSFVADSRGRFKISLRKLKPSVQAPYAQPKFNSSVLFQPTVADNNYKIDYTPNVSHKQFIGDDSFSIRYKGDVSLAINQDVCLNVSNTGILLYHSVDNSVIVSENFPTSKSLNEFVTTMIAKTNSGGVYFNDIEFNHYSVDEKSTDDLIRFTAVPLVANYNLQVSGKGFNAFPCFVSLYDESYHKIEVIFNKEKATCLFYIDGYRCNYIDSGFAFSGTGIFDDNITIGAAGCTIKNFKFENFVSKTSLPRIMMYMSHFLIDGVRNVSNGAGITLGRLNEIINENKEIGSYFVDLEQIENYIYGRGTLPEKCWSIIHDDSDYLSDTNDLLVKKFRNLYSKHAIKPAFALIMTNNSDVKKTQILLDKDIYNFHLHDVDHSKSLNQRTYSDAIYAISDGLLTFRNWLFSTRYYTYPYGGYDINILKLMEHSGVSLAFTVGSADGDGQSMCARYHNCVQPRSNADGGVGSVLLPIL